jgi:nucleotide-binding universal stress UspA family protein
MKLLITTDGSEASLGAVRYVVKSAPHLRHPELHLVTVQAPISSTASALVGHRAVKEYHREEGDAALKDARAVLDAAGLKYECHVLVGEPGEAIAAYARDRDCDQIVMATRGKGILGNLLLGSTTTRVIELATMPVTLVK